MSTPPLRLLYGTISHNLDESQIMDYGSSTGQRLWHNVLKGAFQLTFFNSQREDV